MPEYLSPGVYVEEVSFRARTIEGVSTSVTGFVGPTRYGPVGDVPELLTSFADFERIYGGVDPLKFSPTELKNYLALAVQAYFDNGGVMLYVTRIYNPPLAGKGIASWKSAGVNPVELTARFPGVAGNMQVSCTAKLSASLITTNQPDITRSNLQINDLVFVVSKKPNFKSGFYDVTSLWALTASDATTKIAQADITLDNLDLYKVTLGVGVQRGGRFESPNPVGTFAINANATSGITFQSYFVDPPPSRDRFLHQPFYLSQCPSSGAKVAEALLGNVVTNLAQQGIPALSGIPISQLLSLDPGYVRGLGFDYTALTKLDTNSFSVAALQQFSKPTLTALNIPLIQQLTAGQLAKAKAGDITALVGAINLRAFAQLGYVPYWNLTFALLKSLTNDTAAKYGVVEANLKGFDPQKLALEDVQALSVTALTALKLLPLKTVTSWPAGITKSSTLGDLGALGDAGVAPLGIAAAKTITDVNNAAFGPVTLADVQALSTPALTAMGLATTVKLTVAQLRSVSDATDLPAVANALGIKDLSAPSNDWLGLLTLGDLQLLSNDDALPPGLTAATLKTVDANKLKATLTLTDLKSLPPSIQKNLGVDLLSTIGSKLPLKPTDLTNFVALAGGDDGLLPTAMHYHGADPVVATDVKTGLRTFMDIDEISIIAAPGSTFIGDPPVDANAVRARSIADELITHVQLMRYRVAVLDTPNGQILSDARDYRSTFDTKYAAIYYPWVTIMDPMDPTGVAEIDVPPSGYITGIYARNDDQRSVAKAPGNEVLNGVIGLESIVNTAQQDILNPLGINCIRPFLNRGIRLWGARTLSSDSEWKYINVRRYFAYLEHSIDKGTQFVVFENNNPQLWDSVRTTIEDFLFNEWKNNNLVGNKPTDAYFVRCDRTTMTQNDIDNGRLICLIGVSVNKPAEFVIFRIGQMTADSNN